MPKRTLRESYVLDGVIYEAGEHELPKEVDEALRARGAFGDEPTTAAAFADERRADAVDTDPKVQAAAEKDAQAGRQGAIADAADQAQANADALKRAAKGGK